MSNVEANRLWTQIVFVRHCKVDGPAALYGTTNIGVEQSHNQRACQQIYQQFSQDIELVVSSPLKRCYQLASELAELGDWPIELYADFQEMNFGEFDGIAFDQLGDKWQQLEPFWHDPANFHFNCGETLAQFQQRVIAGWHKLLNSSLGQKIMVITHGGVIRILLAHLLNLDWRNPKLYSGLAIDYASATKIKIFQGQEQNAQIQYLGVPVLYEQLKK